VARYNFKLLGEIIHLEVIAKGTGVQARHYLVRKYGRGNWRKMKGIALVEYENGDICYAELHWFEAHGIGRRDMKAIRDITNS
jgi:hypothetical protein